MPGLLDCHESNWSGASQGKLGGKIRKTGLHSILGGGGAESFLGLILGFNEPDVLR